MRVALVVGSTDTAAIEGISAAGADPAAMAETPAADAEVVTYGRPVLTSGVPTSPSGCPSPALLTRAVRDLLGFDLLVVDAGLACSTAAPTVSMPGEPGGDVREPEPVPAAGELYRTARTIGRAIPDDELFVGESIPGGTTTALGTSTALGEDYGVSSSLPENPTALKRSVVEAGLDASGIDPGDLAGNPVEAVRLMGDPVLAAVAGIAEGALETGTDVTLAGGTQMLAATALVRHAGVDAPLAVATTSFVAGDDSADVRATAADLGVDLVVTDPGFDRADHVAMERFRRGEAKEGVGLGGVLALADREGVPMAAVRDRIETLYDEVVSDRGP